MHIDQADAEAFVGWLLDQAIHNARGDHLGTLPVAPDGRFWLGRIAPEQEVAASRLGERAERLDPCEIGVRIRPDRFDGRTIRCRVRALAWRRQVGQDASGLATWQKTERIDVPVEVVAPTEVGDINASGREEVRAAFDRVGAAGLAAEVRAEVERGKGGPQLVVTLVNVSPVEHATLDTNLYEAELEVDSGTTTDFILDNLPDSFRYDRRVPAYGVNGGVRRLAPGVFATTDYSVYDRNRPSYWDEEYAGPKPDLSFERLSQTPLDALRTFVDSLERWSDAMWAGSTLCQRSREEGWDEGMLGRAMEEAQQARDEVRRIREGLGLLERDADLRRSFMLANSAFNRAPAVKHTEWRPFQLGFLLANVASLERESRSSEREWVDTLWFATGGGKTETYLLYTLTAAFYDRMTGKREGITSWGRFPLRMLSLQQTQRFADVLAAAELIRRDEAIAGEMFSLGFLVGEPGTPNRIEREPRPGQPDPADEHMPAKYQVLIRCPFCTSKQIKMQFDSERWALDHICEAADCPWGGDPLPFRIVDEEIFRWLPTVVLGTLDKAASVALQAAMRGFYGAPEGKCPLPHHGYTYAPRSKNPNGCLYSGCNRDPLPLPQAESLYAPTIRMQDELHLLRDSLGSIDSHYEALLDDLQDHWGSRPKLIASSATLAGHEEQVDTLYRRRGRVFPLPGPRVDRSFWSVDSGDLARRYVGIAPRGVTLEYANDQLSETLQRSVRRALAEPDVVASEAGVPSTALPGLVWAYGVDVVYGTNLKDVEAAARSFESQIPIEPLHPVTLTGRTPLEEVRTILARLTEPEPVFDDRIHLVAASSMLSHGVDIDRLNVMVMLGLPLSSAEFIQTTARVGRTHPGIVFVMHKIGRERDAGVFRIFPSFVQHADRLIDPVPITSRSRRVLELTFPGLEQARVYGMHEHAALDRSLKQLTTPQSLKKAFTRLGITESRELQEVVKMLGFTGPLDENLRRDLEEVMRDFYRALNDPAGSARFVSELFKRHPMLSLRDVEEQVPVYPRGGDS